jgi:polyphosphate kinase 2 (PPK2 family)
MKKSKKAAHAAAVDAAPAPGNLKRSAYEQELEKLHGELVSLQRWVVHKGLKSASSSRAATVPARAAPSRR